MTLAAVLWDLDGTLVDTEPIWMAAEYQLAEEYGAIWTEEDGLALVGNSLLDAGAYIRTRLGIDLSAEAIVDRLVAHVAESLQDGIPWRPGAPELVTALAEAGVPQALVTMSYRTIAKHVAVALPFGASVTGDEVTRGKPHPEPYLRAAELLGVDPTLCLAVEDSGTGATSANAAGCVVLAVPNVVDVPPAPRRVTRAGLENLSVDDLRQIVSSID